MFEESTLAQHGIVDIISLGASQISIENIPILISAVIALVAILGLVISARYSHKTAQILITNSERDQKLFTERRSNDLINACQEVLGASAEVRASLHIFWKTSRDGGDETNETKLNDDDFETLKLNSEIDTHRNFYHMDVLVAKFVAYCETSQRLFGADQLSTVGEVELARVKIAAELFHKCHFWSYAVLISGDEFQEQSGATGAVQAIDRTRVFQKMRLDRSGVRLKEEPEYAEVVAKIEEWFNCQPRLSEAVISDAFIEHFAMQHLLSTVKAFIAAQK